MDNTNEQNTDNRLWHNRQHTSWLIFFFQNSWEAIKRSILVYVGLIIFSDITIYQFSQSIERESGMHFQYLQQSYYSENTSQQYNVCKWLMQQIFFPSEVCRPSFNSGQKGFCAKQLLLISIISYNYSCYVQLSLACIILQRTYLIYALVLLFHKLYAD